MQKEEFVKNYFGDVKKVLDNINIESIVRLHYKILETKDGGGTIFIIGNGGSAATASHMVCDFMKGTINDFSSDDKRLKAISLVDNIPINTAYANDISYDEIFSQQLRNLIGEKDLLLVLTGSGKSKNIIRAIEVAKNKGAYVFSLLGSDGGAVKDISNSYILVPSENYGIIEDFHLMVGHIMTFCLSGCENKVCETGPGSDSGREFLKNSFITPHS